MSAIIFYVYDCSIISNLYYFSADQSLLLILIEN